MKKIISILIVALVALAFMGCPTTYDDLSWGGPAVGDVIGDMNGDPGLALTQSADDPTIYTTEEFTYANDMSAWGGKDGTVNCKVRAVAGDWATAYGSGSTPTIGGDYASLDGGNNITITGFEVGSKYVFYIKTTRDTGVMMKVVKK